MSDLQPPLWPPPAPPPPPGKPPRRIAKKWWWIGGVGALLVALILIGVLAPPGKPVVATVPATPTPTLAQPSVSPVSTVAATAVPTVAPPTPKPTATPKPTPAPPLFRVAGQGIKETRDFAVPAEWTIDYTYNCSNFGIAGNFIVYVYNSDGSLDSNDTGVNELGKRGSGSTANHNDAGTVYLSIDSECSWTVTAVAG